MMFKRPRLSSQKRLVNGSSALALLFLAAACGGPPEPSEEIVIAPLPSVEEEPGQGLVLPAVWQSEDLGSPISSVGIAGALGSTIAVSFEDGGLQYLSFEGDRITEKAAVEADLVGDGRYLLLNGTPVTVFPTILKNGDISVFIHGGELKEPIGYPLDIGTDDYAEGLCTAMPDNQSDGVLRLGFWTQGEPRTLRSGRIVQIRDDLIFLPDEPVRSETDISACLLTDSGATVYSSPAIAAAELTYRSHVYTITLDRTGGYYLRTGVNEGEAFTVRNGLTVLPPLQPVDLAGTGDARGGGYSGGVVVVAGETPDGDHSVTFIDPSSVTLKPFGYVPPGAP